MVSDTAVCRLASRLNGDKGCSIEHSSKVGSDALMGSGNYHARIRFHDDSPSWLIRIPRVTSVASAAPTRLVDYLVQSEYATLKFLETTAVPAPRAFAYGVTGDDYGVGVSFILMEELSGKPWTGNSASGTTLKESRKILHGAAEIMVELERHPFPAASSLLFSNNEIQVSAAASDRFMVLDPWGPFRSSKAYYTAFAEQHLQLVADGQLYTEYPVDAYLVYRFLKDNVAQLVQPDNDNDKEAEQLFLKHVDDKGDHLLVDEDFNIAGIIDWQMARVVPRREAFGPSLISADMEYLCGGIDSLSTEDVMLASAVRDGGSSEASSVAVVDADEKARRFFWGLALESHWSYALPLAKAILRTLGVSQEWTEWK